MQKLILVGVGGFIGSACRYWLSLVSYRIVLNANLRVFLTIGILGGFTTFSTFSYVPNLCLSLSEKLNFFVGPLLMKKR